MNPPIVYEVSLHLPRMPYCPYNGQPLPGTETTLESNTNAPAPPTHAPAIDLPHAVAPVFIVILRAASMLPRNSEYDPIVAELVTCHQTLEALAPLVRRIRVCAPGAPSAVVSVLADWKTKIAFGSPWPSRVISPVIKIDVMDV